MNAFQRFLFPAAAGTGKADTAILVLRVLFGGLLLSHGLDKLGNYSQLAETFADPLGIGSHLSLALVIFAEVVCSAGFIFGFLFRLAALPMIASMAVAFFVFHGADPFAMKELPFAYLAAFVALYISGPGRYSIDHAIRRRLL